MHLPEDARLATRLTHYAEDYKQQGAVVPPIYQTSTFVFDDFAQFQHSMVEAPWGPPFLYSRIGNPTVDIAEKKLAMLEQTEACKLIGTGMGAAALAIMSCVESGSHVVAVDTCYGPVYKFLSEYLNKFGVTHTFVHGNESEDILDAIRPETTMIYLESPSSIIFRLQDISKITKVAREKGITTAIDNTYCTPINCNPATLGVDIVLHSATKYLGGHSDLTAGAICTSRERLERMIRREVDYFGSILAPFPAWLLMRGMRTLKVRMRYAEEMGNTVASWLENHPSADIVHHVGLESFPQRELFLRQMRGSSSLFSFEPKRQDEAAVLRFVEALKIFQLGVSWGGHESLAVPILGKPLGYTESRWCVRFYCGLEDPADLIADIAQAFEASGL